MKGFAVGSAWEIDDNFVGKEDSASKATVHPADIVSWDLCPWGKDSKTFFVDTKADISHLKKGFWFFFVVRELLMCLIINVSYNDVIIGIIFYTIIICLGIRTPFYGGGRGALVLYPNNLTFPASERSELAFRLTLFFHAFCPIIWWSSVL